MSLGPQKRMAAQILKCGENRVWMDTNSFEDISDAITKQDVRSLIKKRIIQKKPIQGTSRSRANYLAKQKSKGRRKGQGSRKGTKYTLYPRKRRWIKTIRPISKTLRELRDSGKIDRHTYRIFYRKAHGGMFKSKKHILSHMKTLEHIKEE